MTEYCQRQHEVALITNKLKIDNRYATRERERGGGRERGRLLLSLLWFCLYMYLKVCIVCSIFLKLFSQIINAYMRIMTTIMAYVSKTLYLETNHGTCVLHDISYFKRKSIHLLKRNAQCGHAFFEQTGLCMPCFACGLKNPRRVYADYD